MDTFLVRNHCSCNLIDYSVLQIFARKNYGETWPKLRNVMVYFNYMTYIFRLNLVCLGFEFIWVHEASCFMLQLNCYRPWPNSLLSFDSTLFLLLIEKYFLLSYCNDLLIKRNIFLKGIACALQFDDQHVGIYAGDGDSYVDFAEVYEPIIREYHHVGEDFKHASDLDASKITGNIDPNAPVHSTRFVNISFNKIFAC